MKRVAGYLALGLIILPLALSRAAENQGAENPQGLLRQVVGIATAKCTGTGVVLSSDDQEGWYVVTNAHVACCAHPDSSLWAFDTSFSRVPVELVVVDREVDLALLLVPGGLDIAPVTPGNSRLTPLGSTTWVVGNSAGLGIAIHRGVFSQRNRSVEGLVSTDAAINPGNSGGALFDDHLRLIGIVTMKYRAEGIGFAIPMERVVEYLDEMRTFGTVRPVYFGAIVDSIPVTHGLRAGYPIVVEEANPGGPAESAGVLPGDRLVSVGDTPIVSLQQFIGVHKRFLVGESVPWRLLRGGNSYVTVEVMAELAVHHARARSARPITGP